MPTSICCCRRSHCRLTKSEKIRRLVILQRQLLLARTHKFHETQMLVNETASICRIFVCLAYGEHDWINFREIRKSSLRTLNAIIICTYSKHNSIVRYFLCFFLLFKTHREREKKAKLIFIVRHTVYTHSFVHLMRKKRALYTKLPVQRFFFSAVPATNLTWNIIWIRLWSSRFDGCAFLMCVCERLIILSFNFNGN